MADLNLTDFFLGSVTVGERGQVVIPAQAREKMNIKPGDKLLAILHPTHGGVFFARIEQFRELTEQMINLVETYAKEATDAGEDQGSSATTRDGGV